MVADCKHDCKNNDCTIDCKHDCKNNDCTIDCKMIATNDCKHNECTTMIALQMYSKSVWGPRAGIICLFLNPKFSVQSTSGEEGFAGVKEEATCGCQRNSPNAPNIHKIQEFKFWSMFWGIWGFVVVFVVVVVVLTAGVRPTPLVGSPTPDPLAPRLQPVDCNPFTATR